MIAKVRNSDKPVITVFGGSDAVPIAVLVIPSTTAIRVKHVMHRIIAGANVSAVNSKRIFKLVATELPLAISLPPIAIERSGNVPCSHHAFWTPPIHARRIRPGSNFLRRATLRVYVNLSNIVGSYFLTRFV
jgi:hypothetical protein